MMMVVIYYNQITTCLPIAVQFICKLHFAERYRLLHPVGAKVGRVRMHVDGVGYVGLGFAARDPIAVHVLPPVILYGNEIQKERVHGVRIQTGNV